MEIMIMANMANKFPVVGKRSSYRHRVGFVD